MKPNPEYILSLMTEKLAGTITAADEHYLDDLIAKDKVVREKWMEVRAAIDEAADNSSGVPVPTRKPLIRILLQAAAAAAILILITAVWYFLGYRQSETSDIAEAPAGNKVQKVQLTLANGQVFNLNPDSNSIKVAGTILPNANKTLSLSSEESLPTGINTMTVPIGQTYKIILDDQSSVWLNSATILSFPFKFTGNAREISIKGEAYLEVTHIPDRPFIVHTDNGNIQVLGTSFNVNSYDSGQVRVALVEGSVRFSNPQQELSLKPGQEAVASETNVSVRAFDERKVLGWRHGLYYFTDASLEYICKVLPRWYGIQVKMDNATIGKEHFSGSVDRNLPVEQFLKDLAATTTVQYYFDDGGTLHFK